MSRILIIGDSWGVGSFRYTPCGTKIEHVAGTGPDTVLQALGHTVKNISITGGSNIEQLNLLEPNYDIILWFQTEINRDILKSDFINTNTYEQVYNITAANNYSLAQEFYNKHNIPFIVIGCLSPIHDSILKFNFYTHIEKCWITSETEIETALNMHSDYMHKVLNNYKFEDKAFIIKEIDKMLEVERILENHNMFSNGVHPSQVMYEKLLSRLHFKIASSN